VSPLGLFAVHTAKTMLSLAALVAVLEAAQLASMAVDHWRYPERYR